VAAAATARPGCGALGGKQLAVGAPVIRLVGGRRPGLAPRGAVLAKAAALAAGAAGAVAEAAAAWQGCRAVGRGARSAGQGPARWARLHSLFLVNVRDVRLLGLLNNHLRGRHQTPEIRDEGARGAALAGAAHRPSAWLPRACCRRWRRAVARLPSPVCDSLPHARCRSLGAPQPLAWSLASPRPPAPLSPHLSTHRHPVGVLLPDARRLGLALLCRGDCRRRAAAVSACALTTVEQCRMALPVVAGAHCARHPQRSVHCGAPGRTPWPVPARARAPRPFLDASRTAFTALLRGPAPSGEQTRTEAVLRLEAALDRHPAPPVVGLRGRSADYARRLR
jgi:hypothetical protein